MSPIKKCAPSIRTRISGGFLLLLAVAFALLGLSFNFVVGKYIESQATQQIGTAKENVQHDVLAPRRNSGPEFQDFQNFMPRVNSIARRATFLTQVQALVIGDDDELVYPVKNDKLADSEALLPDGAQQPPMDDATDNGDYSEKSIVYAAIRGHKVDLKDEGIQRIRDERRTYYLSTMAVDMDGEGGGAYTLVLYMDMTGVSGLHRTLNMVLFTIIGITALVAALVTLLISQRITNPIRRLSDFAEAIGRGDFARRNIGCKDRELIELSDTMNHAAERLEKYDKEQKTFFQNVSHELRTPLMSIRGYAEGIHVGVFEDERSAAGIIIQESDQLTKMVEELLYLSKMDNITAQEQQGPLDVREALSGCGEALRGVALHEGKAIEYDFDEDPVTIVGAEKSLERAFSNLITNGLRYAKSAVTLHCHADGGEAVVCVEDDGLGIDEAELPKVFDRFRKGKGGKHGIGLSIVKAVVVAHKGRVWAENTGHGAVFTVRIPLMKAKKANL